VKFFIEYVITSVGKYILGVNTLQILAGKNSQIAYPLNDSLTLQHALQTPLTILKINLERLSSKQKQKRKLIINQSLLALRRIEEMTNFSQLLVRSKREKEKFELKNSLVELQHVFSSYERVQVSLVLSKNAELRLIGKKLLFQEVVSCLIKNAIESYGTSIHQVTVIVYCRREGKYVRIEVVDFGFGMGRLAKQVAMMRGVTSKQDGQGLGLAFVSQVIEEIFKGKVFIESQPLIGTRAVIHIPLNSVL